MRLTLTASFFLIVFNFFSQQLSLTTNINSIDVCESQSVQVDIQSGSGSITNLDTIRLVLNAPINYQGSLSSNGEFSGYTISTGNLVISNDTLIVTNVNSTHFTVTFDLLVGCESTQVNQSSLQLLIDYQLNQDSWQNFTSNIVDVNSFYLTDQLGGANWNTLDAFIGQQISRSFYYTNTNNSVPFNGVFEFCDTLPLTLDVSAIVFDSIYVSSSNASVIDYSISDSVVKIRLDVSNLRQNDTLEIVDIVHLDKCVTPTNNKTRYRASYGCDTINLCKEFSDPTQYQTSVEQETDDRPILEVNDLSSLDTTCSQQSIQRLIQIINVGTGISTGVSMAILDRRNNATSFSLTHIDTSSFNVFHNGVSVNFDLSENPSPESWMNPWSNKYLLSADMNILTGDTLLISFVEKKNCLDYSDTVLFEKIIIENDPAIRVVLDHPCFPSIGSHNYLTSPSNQVFNLDQSFLNLNGQIGDNESKWFEIKNSSILNLGKRIGGEFFFAYDLNSSQLEVRILLDSGIYLSNIDSLYFQSDFGGISSFLNPNSVNIISGIGGLGTGDTIVARFSFPNNFQQSYSNLPGSYQWKSTDEYTQFFANSWLNFKLTADCSKAKSNARAYIEEQVFYIADTSCADCKIPLETVKDYTNINCPGCILPGWNITKFDIERTNIGYADTNNNFYPDSFPLQQADPADVNLQAVVIGDTMNFEIQAFVSDGDPNDGMTFSNIGFVYDEGQLVFKGQGAEKLRFLEATGTFSWNGTNYPITIFQNNATHFSNGFIEIPMSASDLILYGVTGFSGYNSSCSISLDAKFKAIENFNDGDGPNPYLDVKDITAFYYFGGTSFDQPDVIPDANIVEMDTLSSWTPSQREQLSYWCTAYEGRYIGVGVDFDISQVVMRSPNVDCFYTADTRISGIVGGQNIMNLNTYSETIGNGSLIFSKELRNFFKFDSLKFNFPSQIRPSSIYELRSGNWSRSQNGIPVAVTMLISTSDLSSTVISDTTWTLFPELFSHQQTEYVSGLNFSQYDENVDFRFNVVFENNECIVDTVDIIEFNLSNVDIHFSNLPLTLSGDSLIERNILTHDRWIGVGPVTSIDVPNPEYSILINEIDNSLGYNYALQADFGVISFNTNDNNILRDRNNNTSYNTFVTFINPSGNISDIGIDTLLTIRNQNLMTSSLVQSNNLQTGEEVFHLGKVGGSIPRGDYYSKKFKINANLDCSNLAPGSTDSIYMIYGWNCFEYPTNLEEACFVDTHVIYIQVPEVGLEAKLFGPKSLDLCDTLHYKVVLDPTGNGVVENSRVEVLLEDFDGLSFVNSSGVLSYSGTTVNVNPQITDSSFVWDLDSVINSIAVFDGLADSAVLNFSLQTGCIAFYDSMRIRVSGTNNCGLLLDEENLYWNGSIFYETLDFDSLSYDITLSEPTSCSDSVLITVDYTNLSNNYSNELNQLIVQLPQEYGYSSGEVPVIISSNQLTFELDSSLQSNQSTSFSFYLKRTEEHCDSLRLNTSIKYIMRQMCNTDTCILENELTNFQQYYIKVPPSSFVIHDFDPSSYCLEGDSVMTILYSSENAGILNLLGDNASLLTSVSLVDTNNAEQDIIISDSVSQISFVFDGPCVCPDTLTYLIDCDSFCVVNAGFTLNDTICVSDTVACLFPLQNDSTYQHQWIFNFNGMQYHNYSAEPCIGLSNEGLLSVTHIVTSPCGTDSITKTADVIDFNVQSCITIIGSNPFCEGDSVMLTSNSDFETIVWMNENGDTLSLSDTLVVYTGGVYSATTTNEFGCENTCICTELTTTPNTQIGISDTVICYEGDSLLLTLPNGFNGIWNNEVYGNSYWISSTGNYTIFVDEGECPVADTFNISLGNFEFDILDTTVCTDHSILVTPNISSIGSSLWSTGETTDSILIDSSGIYTVTVTNEYGCNYTDSFEVNYIQIPSAAFYLNDTICTSDTLTCLHPTISDSLFSHEWVLTINGLSFNTTEESPCISLTSVGNLRVTHIVTSECGSDTVIRDANIVDFNVESCITIIGSNPFCEGDSVILTTSSDYSSIVWQDSTGNILGNSDSLVVYSGGVYSATTINEYGCENTCICTELEMIPAVNVNIPDTSLCRNDSLVLYLPNGLIGLWDSSFYGNEFIIFNEEGEHTVTSVNDNQCFVGDTFNVYIKNIKVEISYHFYYQKNCTYLFNAQGNNSYSYRWIYNGNVVGTGNSVYLSLPSNQIFNETIYLEVTDDSSGCVEIIPYPFKRVDCKSKKVYITPNPASDDVIVYSQLDSYIDSRVEIVDSKGKLITSEQLLYQEEQINIEQLKGGMYFFKVYENNRHIETIKIVKQ